MSMRDGQERLREAGYVHVETRWKQVLTRAGVPLRRVTSAGNVVSDGRGGSHFAPSWAVEVLQIISAHIRPEPAVEKELAVALAADGNNLPRTKRTIRRGRRARLLHLLQHDPEARGAFEGMKKLVGSIAERRDFLEGLASEAPRIPKPSVKKPMPSGVAK